MSKAVLSVRAIQPPDFDKIAKYWTGSECSFLLNMGVDLKKVPTREHLVQMLSQQFQMPVEQKRSYCIIWRLNGKPIGHSNTNPTTFGEVAFMHLHIWIPELRNKGLGEKFIKMTLPCFFNNLQLKKLYCEPYALNPAPNKSLQKIGFELEKEYVTTPGSLNFEQPVKRWVLTYEKFKQLKK